MKYISTLIFFVCWLGFSHAQTTIPAAAAKSHVGEIVSITGEVFGGKLLPSNMTLIDVGGRYPHQILTIMIPPADRTKFKGQPEIDWLNKNIVVTGKVILYRNKPEIIVTDPKAIKL